MSIDKVWSAAEGEAQDPIESNAVLPGASEAEKRRWYHFLTLRQHKKKSQSHPSLRSAAAQQETLAMAMPQSLTTTMITANDSSVQRMERGGGKHNKVFKFIREKIESLRYQSLRTRHGSLDNELDAGGGTTDATSEFVTRSPVRERLQTQGELIPKQLEFSFREQQQQGDSTDRGQDKQEAQMRQERQQADVLFSDQYKKDIHEKWLAGPEPNYVMYAASMEMLREVWYWGEMSRRDAQVELQEKPGSSFLVRNSETNSCSFTLSFRIRNMTLHYRIEHREGAWQFEEMRNTSIVTIIQDIMQRCVNDDIFCYVEMPSELQPPMPVLLKHPLSRYAILPQLQELCRRAIQRKHSVEEISQWPLPIQLREFLSIRPRRWFGGGSAESVAATMQNSMH